MTADNNSWQNLLHQERDKDYFKNLLNFIEDQRKSGKNIFPSNKEIFNSLTLTPFESVKVVILGQDPYHGLGQAHGLSFSVREGTAFPPSLNNIFLELKNDLGINKPKSGDLSVWAKQGVFLLNSVLTVESGKPGSHANQGWEVFTDTVIRILNDKKENLVFMLWGAYAQRKGEFIDSQKHLVIKAPHPSPFSAHKGFLGCKHFSKANEYLKLKINAQINW